MNKICVHISCLVRMHLRKYSVLFVFFSTNINSITISCNQQPTLFADQMKFWKCILQLQKKENFYCKSFFIQWLMTFNETLCSPLSWELSCLFFSDLCLTQTCNMAMYHIMPCTNFLLFQIQQSHKGNAKMIYGDCFLRQKVSKSSMSHRTHSNTFVRVNSQGLWLIPMIPLIFFLYNLDTIQLY